MIGKFAFVLLLTVLMIGNNYGQSSTSPPQISSPPQIAPTPVDLDSILTKAEEQVLNYQNTFRDLLATETKTFEKYNKNGELKDRKIVESNFLVYQSSKDENTSSELRNVVKVDDKLVPDSQARADRFLAELEKAKTPEKLLDKIADEGSRYDKTIKINGFTLYEAVALAPNLRPVFDFQLLGSEVYQGSDVYVVSYRQTKKSPFITVNQKETKEKGIKVDFDAGVPGELKQYDVFLSGKLWIDKQTFQLWREERRLIVQSPVPLVTFETIFEYNQSEFGILVPKKITVVDNQLRKISKTEEFTAVKDLRVVFDYSKFKKTNVEVQIIDDPEN